MPISMVVCIPKENASSAMTPNRSNVRLRSGSMLATLMRHTLSSLALVSEEMWLESTDQLREDKFYRFNQTLQEILNLAARLPAS